MTYFVAFDVSEGKKQITEYKDCRKKIETEERTKMSPRQAELAIAPKSSRWWGFIVHSASKYSAIASR